MERKYIKLDKNNVAVIELQETRNILNKDNLLKQKADMTKKFEEEMAIIDEALLHF